MVQTHLFHRSNELEHPSNVDTGKNHCTDTDWRSTAIVHYDNSMCLELKGLILNCYIDHSFSIMLEQKVHDVN